ncbi:glycosyl hydrolase family 28-related protein [Clostridium perfringens]|nr:glycosyl hydrolase family 28-related protein [Clostridium perfringens]
MEFIKSVNLKSFGAKGDGITDDIDAINSSIEYCVKNNITQLYVPEGTYYVSKSIVTMGIKLVGLEEPFIPFLTWDYTRPKSIQDDYNKYKSKCKGSVFTTDKDINLFADGLNAYGIGLLGNRRVKNQNGISQIRGNQSIYLEKCIISGFGKCGVFAPFGLISPVFKECKIIQNGQNGICISNEVGDYTGETNQMYINNCYIARNESHGIYGNISGRGIHITNTSFESNGEPSDTERPKPTNETNVVYGCYLNLYNKGGFSNGAITLDNNYSEETYGLFHIVAYNPVYGISIRSNLWKPYDNINYSCGVLFGGWISGIDITKNNFYTTKDYVLFQNNNNIKNVSIDLPYVGKLAYDGGATLEVESKNDKTFCNILSNESKTIENFGEKSIIKSLYDNSNNTTYYFLNPNKLNDSVFDNVDFGDEGSSFNFTGYALKFKSNYVGILRGWSKANKLLQTHGERYVPIEDGSFTIEKIGGFQTINGNGEVKKILIDWDNSLFVSDR